MRILLNNDMELVLNNENGKDICIASLVDSGDGEVLRADAIDEGLLLEFLRNLMKKDQNQEIKKIAELRLLNRGEPILVDEKKLVYFEALERTKNGEYLIHFTDNGFYKNPADGIYYNLETSKMDFKYIGKCTLNEYLGKADIKEYLPSIIKQIESAVWFLLDDAKDDTEKELLVYSDNYKEAENLAAKLCTYVFPELYDCIFKKDSSDLIFESDGGYGYNLYYFNPDSFAGGQIVRCPFSAEQAARMIDDDDYIDILAENTQYLSDINDEFYFGTIFELIHAKLEQKYLGNDVNAVCKMIAKKENLIGIDFIHCKPDLETEIGFHEPFVTRKDNTAERKVISNIPER